MSGLDTQDYNILMADIMTLDVSAHNKIAEEFSSAQVISNEAMAIASIYGAYGITKNLDNAEDFANGIQHGKVKTRILSEIEHIRERDKKIGDVTAIGQNKAIKKRAEAQSQMDENIKNSPLKLL